MKNMTISFLQEPDIPEAARVISIAMLNNPINVAVFQGQAQTERKGNEKAFSEFLRDSGIIFVAKVKGQIVGLMRMGSCTGQDVPEDHAQGADFNNVQHRQAYWRNEWARRDPKEHHWHLGPIGVLPEHQEKGIGTKLLQRFCLEVDACLAAGYLETDVDRNIPLYKKFGFKVIDESDIFDVKNRYMWRAPTT